MVDADGATKFSDLGRVHDSLTKVEKSGLGIAIGSRAHLVAEAVATVSKLLIFFNHLRDIH